MAEELGRLPTSGDFKKRFPNINVTILFGSHDNFLRGAGLKEPLPEPKIKYRQPKILVFDIETKPIKAWVWGLFDQNVGLEQIIEDWSVLSWAAKWIGNDEVLYQDLSQHKDHNNDEIIIYGIWELLNEADIVVTQNGKKFDVKKLNTKFAQYKLGPPSKYKHIDTLQIKKKNFGLTSNKLAYSTNKFNDRYKKLEHGKFPGMKLWIECLKGNQEAWAEMKEYNIHDVLALEELYVNHLMKWDNTINYGVYTGEKGCCPNCGKTNLIDFGYSYTKNTANQQLKCKDCGTISTSKDNELPKALTKSFLK